MRPVVSDLMQRAARVILVGTRTLVLLPAMVALCDAPLHFSELLVQPPHPFKLFLEFLLHTPLLLLFPKANSVPAADRVISA